MKNTKELDQILALAAEEAIRHGMPYLGTDLLAYELIVGECLTGSLFSEEEKKKTVEYIATLKGDGDPERAAKDLVTTPRVSLVMENATQFAAMYGEDSIGTAHVLMGMIREPECSGCGILKYVVGPLNSLVLRVTTAMNIPAKEALVWAEGVQADDGEDGGSLLETYCRCLSDDVEDGLTEPTIGRTEETDAMIRILCRRTKNNPCLVGEPGVGKTQVVIGLAERILAGDVPPAIAGKRIYVLDVASLVAGTRYRGDFEERIKRLLLEVEQNDACLLFVDELHTLMGAGNEEGSLDAANIFKTAISGNRVHVIGATTLDEYRNHIEKDPAFARRFQKLQIEEPQTEEAVAILQGLRSRYEKFHGVRYTDAAVRACVTLSDRYLNDRRLPDKAIDLMDESGSDAGIGGRRRPAAAGKTREKMEEAVLRGDFAAAAEYRRQMSDEEAGLAILRSRSAAEAKEPVTVTADDVARIVARMTGIPVTRLSTSESERLLHLEEELHRSVIGQNETIAALSKTIRRGRVGLRDPKRPIGSFLFLGPTGVGKTELCKALAQALFGDPEAMIRIDMSEYMEQSSVSKMIGSPPGYVGFEDGGQLCEKVRRKPYSVILFDEVEKAHPDVYNIFLQILDEGRITDSKGRTVNMKNTVIIMTSNAGADRIMNPKLLGFASEADAASDYLHMKEGVMEEVRRVFKPEFLNRIDDICVFRSLTREEIRAIAVLLLSRFADRCREISRMEVAFSDALIDNIAAKGFDPKFGARPVKRAIAETVEDAVAESLLKGEIAEGDTVLLDYADGRVTVRKQSA